jgi:hypothetical protein
VPGEVKLKYLALHVVVESPKPAEAWNILPVSCNGPCGRHVDWLSSLAVKWDMSGRMRHVIRRDLKKSKLSS